FFASLDSSLVGEPKTANYFFVSLVAEDDHELKLRDAIRRLHAAREQIDQTKPHTQVRLATWLLLVGELTSHWEELCLSSNSAEAFAQGKQLLDSIAASLDSSPELARLLEEDPELALRIDAALV